MVDRRGSRFAAEALFLVALAVALALARLDALEIAGVMFVGWVIVAAVEWSAWRGEPHYGSGMPPRYFVPSVALPPAQPLEQVEVGYPDASREEAPTWVASAALRAEVLGEWPVATPVAVEPEEEDEDDDEPAFLASADADADPWTVVELPVEPLEAPEPVDAEPEPAAPDPEPEPEPELAPVGVSPDPAPPPAAEEAPGRRARHRLDPLADQPRRRFGRGRVPDGAGVVEVPARPTGVRPLPGESRDA